MVTTITPLQSTYMLLAVILFVGFAILISRVTDIRKRSIMMTIFLSTAIVVTMTIKMVERFYN